MTISSPAFKDGQLIPSEYTCEGEGINPPLVVGDVPNDAKSLLLILDDPDAPTGLFTHWVVWNIPPTTKQIEADSTPSGSVEGENSLGEIGYTPPCPPTGVHHYQFTLYALSSTLPYDAGTPRDSIEEAMQQFVVDSAQLIGQYIKKELVA